MELKLREIRQSRNVSQKQLSEEIGVSAQTVYQWEHGLIRIPLEDACKCADYLGVSIDELAGRDNTGAAYFERVFKQLNDEGQAYLVRQAKYALSDIAFQAEFDIRQVQ